MMKLSLASVALAYDPNPRPLPALNIGITTASFLEGHGDIVSEVKKDSGERGVQLLQKMTEQQMAKGEQEPSKVFQGMAKDLESSFVQLKADVLTNGCTAGRTAALATYNSLNAPAHVVGSVARTVCGCVSVYKSTMCALSAFPPCTGLNVVFGRMLSASQSTWEAVKATTKMC